MNNFQNCIEKTKLVNHCETTKSPVDLDSLPSSETFFFSPLRLPFVFLYISCFIP
eukprot:m.266891 g.266891  ORF g.266891 m.266891 type:complete len:55 (+) comp31715_c0_seq1:118-282(+)